MRKSFILFGLCALFAACSDSDSEPMDEPGNETGNKVLLLKVDLMTNEFEGGKELTFDEASTFTISHDYETPGDFGGITLYYDELDAKIFEGTIVWDGLGEMTYPEALDPEESFDQLVDDAVEMPDMSQFETIEYVQEGECALQPDHQSLWAAIDNLQVVQEYRESNPDAKVHLFLYAPSVGVGNPAEWDWFVILKN